MVEYLNKVILPMFVIFAVADPPTAERFNDTFVIEPLSVSLARTLNVMTLGMLLLRDDGAVEIFVTTIPD